MRKKKESEKTSYFKAQDIKIQLTKLQKPIVNFFIENQISILTGDPGTGKTTLALYYAVKQLLNKEFEKIIISKPVIETGRSIGYLPGELDDKLAPYKQSYIDIIAKLVGGHKCNDLLRGKVVFENIGFVRGKTFENSCIILDESQNCDLQSLISFITRIDDSSKMILLGDEFQNDLGKHSGLNSLLKIIDGIDNIGYKDLGEEYQMRSKIVSDIYKSYKIFLNLYSNTNNND